MPPVVDGSHSVISFTVNVYKLRSLQEMSDNKKPATWAGLLLYGVP